MRKMKVMLAALLCVAFAGGGVLLGCSGTDYKKTALPHYAYTTGDWTADYNQQLFYRNDLDVTLGDPSTFYVTEGEYAGYLFSTGTSSGVGYDFYRSKDFVNWEPSGEGFVKSKDHFGVTSFWAPQVLYDKDAGMGGLLYRSRGRRVGQRAVFSVLQRMQQRYRG